MLIWNAHKPWDVLFVMVIQVYLVTLKPKQEKVQSYTNTTNGITTLKKNVNVESILLLQKCLKKM